MDIVLIGAPGAGKGTQAEKLAPLLTSRHIASGDLFHEAFEEQTELGVKAQKYVALGELVPDEITIPLVIRHIEEPESMQGVVLEGFPRTLAQAQELDAELQRINRQIDLAIYLKGFARAVTSEAYRQGVLPGAATCVPCQISSTASG